MWATFGNHSQRAGYSPPDSVRCDKDIAPLADVIFSTKGIYYSCLLNMAPLRITVLPPLQQLLLLVYLNEFICDYLCAHTTEPLTAEMMLKAGLNLQVNTKGCNIVLILLSAIRCCVVLNYRNITCIYRI